MRHFENIAEHAEAPSRTYTVCFFEPNAVVPQVVLIDAVDDREALAEARVRRAFTMREVWDRHRLVGVIQAAS